MQLIGRHMPPGCSDGPHCDGIGRHGGMVAASNCTLASEGHAQQRRDGRMNLIDLGVRP